MTLRTRLTPDEVVAALAKDVKDRSKMDPLELASDLLGYPGDVPWTGTYSSAGFEISNQPGEEGKRGNRVPLTIRGIIRAVPRGSDVDIRIRTRTGRLALMAFIVAGPALLVLTAAVASGEAGALCGLLFPLAIWATQQFGFTQEAKRAEAFLRSILHERDPDVGGPYRMPGG